MFYKFIFDSQNKISAFLYKHFHIVAALIYVLLYIAFELAIRKMLLQGIKPSNIDVLDGVIYFLPETRKTIFWYIISVPFTFIYMICGYFYYQYGHDKLHKFSDYLKQNKGMFPFIGGVLIILLCIFSGEISNGKSIFIISLLILIYPSIHNVVNQFIKKVILFFTTSLFYKMVLFIALGYSIFLFKPFIWDKIHIVGEFLDIPTTSIIKNKYLVSPSDYNAKEYKKIVGTTQIDTTEFIETMPLWGISKKYDIRTAKQDTENCAKISLTPMLDNFLRMMKNKAHSIEPAFYRAEDGLCFAMAPDQKLKKQLIDITTSKQDKKSLLFKFIQLDDKIFQFNKNKLLMRHNYHRFNKNNNWQQHWQIMSRGYIHHHNHVLAPINELDLGRSYKLIFAQYGLFNAYIMKSFMKFFGDIDYNTWEKVLFSSYLFYIFMSLVITYLITKNIKYVVYMLVATLAAINTLSFLYLYLGPGAALPRHFFDFLLFFLYWLYLTKQKKIYFVLTLLTALCAVINNLEFGLILFLALCGVCAVKNWKNIISFKFNFEIFGLGFLFIPVCIVVFLLLSNGSGDVANSFLSGMLAFPIPTSVISGILCIITLGYMFFAWLLRCNYMNIAYLYLLDFLYLQALVVYWLRSYAPYHFLPFMNLFAFLLILVLYAVFKKFPRSEKNISIITMLILLVWFFGSINSYFVSYKSFRTVFKNTITYDWTLPRTNFISTMNPSYFTDSIDLIHKYSPKDNGIYIISKYDNFLPFISQRYSALPVIDLQWYLVTEYDLRKILNKIVEAQPEYLFADKDLSFRNFEYDIVDPSSVNSYLHEESVWRVQRMKQIQKIFHYLEPFYEPVESSTLLTVYKKKSKAPFEVNYNDDKLLLKFK